MTGLDAARIIRQNRSMPLPIPSHVAATLAEIAELIKSQGARNRADALSIGRKWFAVCDAIPEKRDQTAAAAAFGLKTGRLARYRQLIADEPYVTEADAWQQANPTWENPSRYEPERSHRLVAAYRQSTAAFRTVSVRNDNDQFHETPRCEDATDNRHIILFGDCREMLNQLVDRSIDIMITSPPYHGRIDYGHERQIGSEATVAGHIENLRIVLRIVWNKLADNGTAWIVLDDRYASNGRRAETAPSGRGKRPRPKVHKDIVPLGNVLLIPQRLAIALQDDGWIVRSYIVWDKSQTMEQVTGRPRHVHETILMLAKTPHYYYDPLAENRTDVWRIAPVPFDAADLPVPPFPVELPHRILQRYCRSGGIVLDPFGGIGTTAVAAKQLGLRSVLIEINASSATLAKDAITSLDAAQRDIIRTRDRRAAHAL